ncbi:phospholipase D-like domain-containing protein [Desulfuromonas sp. TF]|uniref:phospholipase D-like domain-containing protein n=1 Tax=Desulfuromonas sp. TF TaxID=1232410 RepID=UPI0003FCA4B0|nr:phospholipase D-like domain-containing protein [Desulfuromonas sp. TF]
MNLRESFYFRSIDRKWKKEISGVKGKLIVLSPYITSKTAELVLDKYSGEECDVYTTFKSESFISGASSLDALKSIIKMGLSLWEIQGLHAKMIISPDGFATIGSQNLTFKGTKNLEASIYIKDREQINHILNNLSKWLSLRREITLQMILDLEEALTEIRDDYLDIIQKLDTFEHLIREKEDLRRIKNEILAIKKAINEHKEMNSLDIAKDFIRSSAWWLKHPTGPVRAPSHQYNIYSTDNEFRIDFGANTFLITRAIDRCIRTIHDYINKSDSELLSELKNLETKLYMNVQGAVAGYDGKEYSGFYPLEGNDLTFGTQSIDVKDFLQCLYRYVPFHKILALGSTIN